MNTGIKNTVIHPSFLFLIAPFKSVIIRAVITSRLYVAVMLCPTVVNF